MRNTLILERTNLQEVLINLYPSAEPLRKVIGMFGFVLITLASGKLTERQDK